MQECLSILSLIISLLVSFHFLSPVDGHLYSFFRAEILSNEKVMVVNQNEDIDAEVVLMYHYNPAAYVV